MKKKDSISKNRKDKSPLIMGPFNRLRAVHRDYLGEPNTSRASIKLNDKISQNVRIYTQNGYSNASTKFLRGYIVLKKKKIKLNIYTREIV